jgi:hypothetical protein
MRRRKQTDWAWLAGILDGEGCLSVGRNNGAGGRYIGLHVVVRMADEDAVRRAYTIAGVGTLKLHRPFTTNRRALWEWNTSSQEAARTLRLVLPYLVTKRVQAKWFIKLATRMAGRRGEPLTQRERAIQDEIVRVIKEEKARR